MLNKVKRRLRGSEDGFTLIELLVVITILGILAAVVVFSVGGVNDKGTESACSADLSTLQTAQEAYFALTGSYGDMDQLAGLKDGPKGKKKVLSQKSRLYNTTTAGVITAKATTEPDFADGFDEACPNP